MNVVSISFNNKSVKLVDAEMQNTYLCVTLLVKHKKIPFIAVSPCSNISENSGKHFILQGRRVRESDKINKPLMLPAAKIASH